MGAGSLQMIQTTGLHRGPLDKFYTKPECALDCYLKFIEFICPTEDDLIIEPSAGNGSFSNIIQAHHPNHRFYDIAPENDSIEMQDFLQLDYTGLRHNHKAIHIVGNPPFGRQSSDAKKFIKRCCLFAHSISFILPKSFKKESFQKTFDLKFHLIHQIDLEDNSFNLGSGGGEKNVPCVFQIWRKEVHDRDKNIPLTPIGFEFVKRDDCPHFSLRRIGVHAGSIYPDIKQSTESHYYIKLDPNVDKNAFHVEYKNITFEHNNTVGARSVSKQEFIEKINALVNKCFC